MKTEGMENLMSLGVSGAFGWTCGFGATRFGFNRLGYYSEFSGIYQRKRSKKGWVMSREIHYRTKNPKTEKQQAWRAVFASGLLAWRDLTDSQKLILSNQGRKLCMTGFNLFQSRYLRNHLLS